MKQQRSSKPMVLLLTVALTVLFTQSVAPAHPANAQELTPVSDLAVNLVSVPKNSKACEVFQAIFTVTNLGPDPATNIGMVVHIPDAYHDIAVLGAPYSLAVGETATFSAVIWVGSYIPGETNRAWVGVTVSTPAAIVDPNLENNTIFSDMKIVSKPVKNCLPRY